MPVMNLDQVRTRIPSQGGAQRWGLPFLVIVAQPWNELEGTREREERIFSQVARNSSVHCNEALRLLS